MLTFVLKGHPIFLITTGNEYIISHGNIRWVPSHHVTRVDLRRRRSEDILRYTAGGPLTPPVYTACVRMYTMYNVYSMNVIVCVCGMCVCVGYTGIRSDICNAHI